MDVVHSPVNLNGDAVVTIFGGNSANFNLDLYILMVFIGGFMVLTYICLLPLPRRISVLPYEPVFKRSSTFAAGDVNQAHGAGTLS